jgi:hypothetical protein
VFLRNPRYDARHSAPHRTAAPCWTPRQGPTVRAAGIDGAYLPGIILRHRSESMERVNVMRVLNGLLCALSPLGLSVLFRGQINRMERASRSRDSARARHPTSRNSIACQSTLSQPIPLFEPNSIMYRMIRARRMYLRDIR